MTPPSTRPRPARRPVLGLVAELLGPVGVVVGILGIGGLWLVQGWIDAGIDDGLITARAAIERAAAKADESPSISPFGLSGGDGEHASRRRSPPATRRGQGPSEASGAWTLCWVVG